MTHDNDNDNYTFATEEEALEAATKALVLEIQNVDYDNDTLLALAEVEPITEFDGTRHWVKLYDTEMGGEAIVARSLEVEWVG